jgi:hypothetical protein
MRLTFISKFVKNNHVFEVASSKSNMLPINVNDHEPIEETYYAKIVNNIIPSIIPNIIHDTKEHALISKLFITDKLSIGSYIGVPIKYSSSKIHGTFCYYKLSPDDTLNKRDLPFLIAIGDIGVFQSSWHCLPKYY